MKRTVAHLKSFMPKNMGEGRYLSPMSKSMRREMEGWNDVKKERFEAKWQNLSEGKRNELRGKSKARAMQAREADYWDYAPSEFRTETLLTEARGAGFNSMFEDTNARSAALSLELTGARHAPPLATKPRVSAPKTLQDLYSNIPELKSLHSLTPGMKPAQRETQNPFDVGPEESMMHPYNSSMFRSPFPISEKERNPFPRSNVRRSANKGDSRVP